MEELELRFIEIIDTINEKLYTFLDSCGVVVNDRTTANMLSLLENVIAIKKNKSYTGVTFSDDGVITNLNKIDGIVVTEDFPSDILRGYYKYDNGKIKIDEILRQKLWR